MQDVNKKENKLLEYLEQADYYKSNNDYRSAIEYYEKSLEILKTNSALYTVTADLYSKMNGSESLERQLELYLEAYKLNSDNRLALHGLAFGYEKLGRDTVAKIYYEKLLQNNPTENDYYNYGGFLIHCGDFENGHKYFTHRFNIDDINLKYPANETKKWDLTTNISDKTLLVHYEQGFGDTIMYSRFVPFLKKVAKKVIFVVQKELYDLISNSNMFKDIEIVKEENDAQYDVNMALLDILYVLKFNSSVLSVLTTKYLDINQDKVNAYKDKYLQDDNCFKIGLSCSGDKDANYNGRNLDILKVYDALKNIPNIRFYNLQKDESNFENLISLGQNFNDFTDSACAVKNMNLIVSTDNVVLNLAGALGMETIGIYNKETNYRWFKTEGDNVGWYESVRPLQAKKQNDWDDVLKELKEEIETKLNNYNNV